MNNLLLRLLDRQELGTTSVPGVRYFPPAPPAEARVRTVLGLDDQADTYTPLVLCRLIDAWPYLRGLVDETARTYDHMLDQQPLFSPGVLGALRRTASEWPVDRVLRVELLAAQQLRVSVGGQQEVLDYTEEGDQITALWPSWSGLTGTLDSLAFVDSLLEIGHRPTRLDLSGLRQRLLETPEHQLVLQQTGLSRLFLQAPTDEEAVASSAVALAVHNQDVVFS